MQRILITGAGSGMGRDAAIQLARRGHLVLATTQFEEQARLLNRLADENKLSLKAFKLDICNEEDRMKVHKYDIDVLINNAAVGESGSVAEIPIERYRRTFETNVFSSIALTQEVIKDMVIKGEGRIIFISSLAGRVTLPFFSPYCATKFAIESLASSLRSEMKGIRLRGIFIDVAIISPGVYATGFNQLMLGTKFKWMNESSYFYEDVEKIKIKESLLFRLLELTSNKTIVKKYIQAVEDHDLKERYTAPMLQGIFIQLLRTFRK